MKSGLQCALLPLVPPSRVTQLKTFSGVFTLDFGTGSSKQRSVLKAHCCSEGGGGPLLNYS
jgi:hypothetical protein